MPSNAGFA